MPKRLLFPLLTSAAEAIARKVGIITLPTAREVAAEDGVAEADIPLSDPRVRAVVRAGAQIRDLPQVRG